MFKRNLLLILCSLLVISCGGSEDDNQEEVTVHIKSYRSVCDFSVQSLCIIARFEPQTEYQDFHLAFENFTPEWGHSYELNVLVTSFSSSDADQLPPTYEVLQLISENEDVIGTEYQYDNAEIKSATFTFEDGNYLFLGHPYTCLDGVDCDVLVAMTNSGGLVNLTFEYLGNGEIGLSYWN
ncbi:DUF4377 domain-containing protein [Thalassotalea litorea]|uniref:DUF4377 domain-containing protein n=1 Tax=Thalassotalea litorea TaxID=2020715 RepID=UPI0037364C9F